MRFLGVFLFFFWCFCSDEGSKSLVLNKGTNHMFTKCSKNVEIEISQCVPFRVGGVGLFA